MLKRTRVACFRIDMHRVRVERAGEAAVVSAQGELDAFTAPSLSDALSEAATEGDDRVVIDLSRVAFMDSTALGLVVKAVNEIGDRGGDVRLVLPQRSARRIFEITTLDRFLPVELSRADALRALSGESDGE
jgi:anti-sigma B factor antagonist